MKKSICLLFAIFGLIGCKTVATKTANEVAESTYFTANGNEPFWNVTIAKDSIVFKSLVQGFEQFSFPHVEPVRAMDANVKMYQLASDEVKIDIQIFQTECINSMSGEVSKYTVKIDVKRSKAIDNERFEGCGKYIADYRLTDIWVLEELKGKKVSVANFTRELPLIEIDASKNNFFGYAGCNRMSGTLFFEKGVVRFTNIVTTKMMCEPTNSENEFLQALQSTRSYSIENNRLTLSNSYGNQVVFKKVD